MGHSLVAGRRARGGWGIPLWLAGELEVVGHFQVSIIPTPTQLGEGGGGGGGGGS